MIKFQQSEHRRFRIIASLRAHRLNNVPTQLREHFAELRHGIPHPCL